ncbi:MAG: HNH endonuclease [Candidatus Xenobiia bacterium LiM19]
MNTFCDHYKCYHNEKAHLRFARNNAILKRDRFRCQVPGCNCRRNLHIHHIIPRSHGGSDEPLNKLTREKHYLRLLHNLLTLKIEGTAPHNLTFTFGSPSHVEERPFMKFARGRKVLREFGLKSIIISQMQSAQTPGVNASAFSAFLLAFSALQTSSSLQDLASLQASSSRQA